MSNVTPIGRHGHVDLPCLSLHQLASSPSLAAGALGDSQEAFRLLAQPEPSLDDRVRASSLLARCNDRLRVLADRLDMSRAGDGGTTLARLVVEAGAVLPDGHVPAIAPGWPACKALFSLSIHERWSQFTVARLSRDLMERQGFVFAESYAAFEARIKQELCI